MTQASGAGRGFGRAILGGGAMLGGLLWFGAAEAQAAAGGWSFTGPFGRFEAPALAEGLEVYRSRCASCHGLGPVTYRELAGAGLALATAAGLARKDGRGLDDVMAGPRARSVDLGGGIAPRRDEADRVAGLLRAGHAGRTGLGAREAGDVVGFLVWTGHPHLAARHLVGVQSVAFLSLLGAVVVLGRIRRGRGRLGGGS